MDQNNKALYELIEYNLDEDDIERKLLFNINYVLFI
jgi:hypothetical protein